MDPAERRLRRLEYERAKAENSHSIHSTTMVRPNPKSASKTTSAFRHWYSPEVIPIWIMIGGASLGAAWYLTRLARSPDVIWDKKVRAGHTPLDERSPC